MRHEKLQDCLKHEAKQDNGVNRHHSETYSRTLLKHLACVCIDMTTRNLVSIMISWLQAPQSQRQPPTRGQKTSPP